MKKFLYTSLVLFGFLSMNLLMGNAQEYSEKKHGENWAFFYADKAQVGVSPDGIIVFTDLDNKEDTRFDLSNSGGIIVPSTGNYLVNYRVLASNPASVALFRNGNLVKTSAFGSIAATTPISGSTILSLKSKDVLTIRSIENSKVFNTVIPAGSTCDTLPVSLTIQLLK